jgi:hypothetical protein
MPYGSTEEPDVEFTMEDSVAPAVESSGVRSGKSVAPEFGRWRTVVVSSAVGANSATPGAQRILNRSQRRHRGHIIVTSTGSILGVPAQPAVPATTVAAQNVNSYPVQVVIAANGATITNVSVNGVTVGTAAGTYVVPAYGSISIAYAVAVPTWVWSAVSGTPQPLTDGIILGSKDEICSGQPAIIGSLGGFLAIGSNTRWEAQAELWVCYPASNSASVFVTFCDEVYASEG